MAAYSEAQELRLKGALLAAHDKLLICTQQGCPVPVVSDCTGWLAEVEGNLSSVVFAVSDPSGRDITDAQVSFNGRVVGERTDGRALSLDPGTYTFSFEAPGYRRAQQTVAMRQSEKNRIVRIQLSPAGEPVSAATSAPPPARPSIPLATFILGGTAVVGAGTFAYFGLTGLDKKHQADRCQSSCGTLIDDGRRDYVIADIALGVAVGAAAAALLVWWFHPAEPRASEHAFAHPVLSVEPSRRAAQLSWSGRF